KNIIKNKTKQVSQSEPESEEPDVEEPEVDQIEQLVSKPIELYPYQADARDKWLKNDFCGLLEMATGTGKTYLAFGCINKLQNLHQRTAVVIAIPQKHLIEQWKRELAKWNNSVKESDRIVIEETVTCNSDYRSTSKDWEDKLDEIMYNFNDMPIGSSTYVTNHIVIFTTQITLAESIFTKRILDLENTKKFLIVDEVHNIGENSSKNTLLEEYDCRLGLSATPTRHMDEIG
ncbi:uncharacterized protein METZ01_LOCUS508384, partial [marine metagenome]